MNKVGAVILVRYNSSRLPGKALMDIAGKPVLLYIVERLLKVFADDQIVIATSVEDSDQPLVNFAAQKKIKCFRGSLDNVAERFYQAASSQNWDYAIRINGDNIFADISLIEKVKVLSENGAGCFISNVKNRTFPKGMSVESVKLSYFASLLPMINASTHYREHVTAYLYDNEKSDFTYLFNSDIPDAAGIQLALDTIEDFERSRNLISRFVNDHTSYNLKEILTLIELHNE